VSLPLEAPADVSEPWLVFSDVVSLELPPAAAFAAALV